MAKVTKAEQEEALDRLRGWLKPGTTVHTVMKHRSTSGMYRAIDVLLLMPRSKKPGDVDILWLSRNVATALGWRFDEAREAVGVNGTGMDMGFHLVYELSYRLFGGGGWRCIGRGCPSNDHSNGAPRRAGTKHSDGGYALNHKWL